MNMISVMMMDEVMNMNKHHFMNNFMFNEKKN
jgi:hypothetical protein